MKITKFALAGVLLSYGVLGVQAPASAAVLYDNGAPTGTGSRPINFGNTIVDSFTLTDAATVTGVTFASFDFPGVTTTGVNWAITPTVQFNAATTQASLTSSYLFTNANGYRIDNNSFSIDRLTLAAGTYYLLLNNATTSAGGSASWAQSGGPSQAYQNGFPYEVSEAFQITGTSATAAVPEPSSWALLISGFGLAGGVLRRDRRRGLAPA